jgi:hypothetical protein
MSFHPNRECEFVGGYHEERTEEPHAQKNLRFYQNTAWNDLYGWAYGGSYYGSSAFGLGAYDGSGESTGTDGGTNQ